MTDLHKQITDALAQLAGRHGVSNEPARESETARDTVPTFRRRPAASSDMRDSLDRLRPTRPGAQPVPRNARDLEGRYATVAMAVGYVAVYIDSVERKTNGSLKAYVLRLDTRERQYVTLDRLEDVRDAE